MLKISAVYLDKKRFYSLKKYELSHSPGYLLFEPTDGALIFQFWDLLFWI